MHVIKQLEERNVAIEIDTLLWSDRMDLVALSNIRGSVSLQRLSWTRVWNLEPPKEGVTVKNMAWRPDGKVLAISYSNREVLLVNIENKAILCKLEVCGDISCILWTREKTLNNSSNLLGETDETHDYMKFLDHSSLCLPDLPPLSNSQEDTKNFELFHDQTELNLLVVGTCSGSLHISIFGQFPCMTVDLGANNSVLDVHFSDDLSRAFVTIRNEHDKVQIVVLNTEIFQTHVQELFAVALKHGHLNSLVTYLFDTMTPLKETWETILMELDLKLSKYASKVPEGTVTADFLDLLMFGITSDEMQEFLLHDLTEKGLKKFGQIVEMCYTNIQKLLLKHVSKAAQNIAYHLTELRGMARLDHRYEVLGLSEDVITSASNCAGALLAKVGEMHQIISHFSLNYRAFFRWLYLAILHLAEEAPPSEAMKISQQDVAHVADFVQNFDKIGENNDGFVMERLGQYLRDEPLTAPPKAETSMWEEFLSDNQCITNHQSIIKRYKEYSLIMQLNELKELMYAIFTSCKRAIRQPITATVIDCLDYDHQSFTKINDGTDGTFVAFLSSKPPAAGVYFLEMPYKSRNVRGCFVQFPYDVLDVKFYSTGILSILLQQEGGTGILYQFPVKLAQEKSTEIDVKRGIVEQLGTGVKFDSSSGVSKQMEGMVCRKLAVSGCRRVCIVLGESGKKVRLFEMEAEEDEDDEAEMTRSDCSMQE